MFVICGDSIDVPPGCINLLCGMSTCYIAYFMTYEKVTYALNIALTVGITLSYALVDISVMFIICGDFIDVPPGCISILCGMSTCYINYWLSYEKVTYALNVVLSDINYFRVLFREPNSKRSFHTVEGFRVCPISHIFVFSVVETSV
ncbi:unnamed protein product [Caenorhabditis nigoni]